MSGTRLLSPGEPATEVRPADLDSRSILPALLIVAHGERGGAGTDRLVHDLVDRIRQSGQFRSVHACFISKEPTLTDTLVDLSPGPVVVYPLFMSDGYFVRRAIPGAIAAVPAENRTGDRPVAITTPFGLSPYLPGLVVQLARETATGCGHSPRDCRVLLVAHGSKHDSASRQATLRLAGSLDRTESFAGIGQCFLEEVPFVDDRIAALQGPVIVVGLFAGEGMHGAVDLPGAVRNSGRNDIFLAMPLARAPGLLEVIQEDLSRSRGDVHETIIPGA